MLDMDISFNTPHKENVASQTGTPNIGSRGTPKVGTPRMVTSRNGTPKVGTPRNGTPKFGTPKHDHSIWSPLKRLSFDFQSCFSPKAHDMDSGLRVPPCEKPHTFAVPENIHASQLNTSTTTEPGAMEFSFSAPSKPNFDFTMPLPEPSETSFDFSFTAASKINFDFSFNAGSIPTRRATLGGSFAPRQFTPRRRKPGDRHLIRRRKLTYFDKHFGAGRYKDLKRSSPHHVERQSQEDKENAWSPPYYSTPGVGEPRVPPNGLPVVNEASVTPFGKVHEISLSDTSVTESELELPLEEWPPLPTQDLNTLNRTFPWQGGTPLSTQLRHNPVGHSTPFHNSPWQTPKDCQVPLPDHHKLQTGEYLSAGPLRTTQPCGNNPWTKSKKPNPWNKKVRKSLIRQHSVPHSIGSSERHKNTPVSNTGSRYPEPPRQPLVSIDQNRGERNFNLFRNKVRILSSSGQNTSQNETQSPPSPDNG